MIGVNHVAVEVDDIDGALAFFEQIFGDLRLRGRGRHMAFIDLGDQFIALEAGRTQGPDGGRHVGLVVDDAAETLARAGEAGARLIGPNDFVDPSGNRWQILEYADVQFSKAPRILDGMGLGELEKSKRAQNELRAKNLGD
jgi:lactoylglutathione lyase